jgi:hypothetical protein
MLGRLLFVAFCQLPYPARPKANGLWVWCRDCPRRRATVRARPQRRSDVLPSPFCVLPSGFLLPLGAAMAGANRRLPRSHDGASPTPEWRARQGELHFRGELARRPGQKKARLVERLLDRFAEENWARSILNPFDDPVVAREQLKEAVRRLNDSLLIDTARTLLRFRSPSSPIGTDSTHPRRDEAMGRRTEGPRKQVDK